jgi:hypothetical protein
VRERQLKLSRLMSRHAVSNLRTLRLLWHKPLAKITVNNFQFPSLLLVLLLLLADALMYTQAWRLGSVT